MAIDKIIIGSNRQSSLTAGVDNNNFVRVQDLNGVIDDANTDIAANTAAITANATAASNNIEVAEVTLSAGNMALINGTPQVLVAAPGAGLALEFVDALVIYDHAAVFTGGGAVSFVEETSGTTLSATVAATVFTTAAADSINKVLGLSNAITKNKGIAITNATGAFGGGTDSVVRVKVFYRTISTGLQ